MRRHSLIKTLLKAGIITERTRAHYGMWVNLDELVAEGDRMVGDEVAEEGIRSLKEDQCRQAEGGAADQRLTSCARGCW